MPLLPPVLHRTLKWNEDTISQEKDADISVSERKVRTRRVVVYFLLKTHLNVASITQEMKEGGSPQ
jgi:hypothetical protein